MKGGQNTDGGKNELSARKQSYLFGFRTITCWRKKRIQCMYMRSVVETRSLQFWVENKWTNEHCTWKCEKDVGWLPWLLLDELNWYTYAPKRGEKKFLLQNGGKYPYTFFSCGENVSLRKSVNVTFLDKWRRMYTTKFITCLRFFFFS